MYCMLDVGWWLSQKSKEPSLMWGIMSLITNTHPHTGKHLLIHIFALLTIALRHSSLVRHWHTHIIDFHLDNLTFTDTSQPLRHGHPVHSWDVRACLTVTCCHISSLMFSCSHALSVFFSRFVFFQTKPILNKLDINGERMPHRSIRLHTNAHTHAVKCISQQQFSLSDANILLPLGSWPVEQE